MYHQPVLLKEVLSFWHVRKGGFYVDGTVGTGGHTEALLEKDPSARCLALDCDPDALAVARDRLKRFEERVFLLKESYANLPEVILKTGFPAADGVLLDLGVSTLQIESSERGFSFLRRGPLDMRMDPTSGESAADLIDRISVNELAQIIRRYGEEPLAKMIASSLKKAVSVQGLRDTVSCAEVISRVVFSKTGKSARKIHPATRTFQALRIAVNGEIENLKKFLGEVPALLAFGGRIVVISFHSLEDRLVKSTMRGWSKGCICPSDFPQCVCGQRPIFKILTHKALKATEMEVKENRKSHSARMRAAEKI